MKTTIKVLFADFWPDFKPEELMFYKFLIGNFDVLHTEISPDFVFFSVFFPNGAVFKQYPNSIRIFVSAENVAPDFSICDYAITSDHCSHPRHYRIPVYRLLDNNLTNLRNLPEVTRIPTKFCNFLYSNNNLPTNSVRNEFRYLLETYKKVDSGGALDNNIGYRVTNKLDFINDYKFTIAFENSSNSGYTTEKLVDALGSNSIPVYWGNPNVDLDFNTRAFINCHDYRSFQEAVDEVIAIDKDHERWLSYKRQPPFSANHLSETEMENAVEEFIKKIVNDHKPEREPLPKIWGYRQLVEKYRITKMARHRALKGLKTVDYLNFLRRKLCL